MRRDDYNATMIITIPSSQSCGLEMSEFGDYIWAGPLLYPNKLIAYKFTTNHISNGFVSFAVSVILAISSSVESANFIYLIF